MMAVSEDCFEKLNQVNVNTDLPFNSSSFSDVIWKPCILMLDLSSLFKVEGNFMHFFKFGNIVKTSLQMGLIVNTL